MASAWGDSWGEAWGVSWEAGAAVAETPAGGKPEPPRRARGRLFRRRNFELRAPAFVLPLTLALPVVTVEYVAPPVPAPPPAPAPVVVPPPPPPEIALALPSFTLPLALAVPTVTVRTPEQLQRLAMQRMVEDYLLLGIGRDG